MTAIRTGRRRSYLLLGWSLIAGAVGVVMLVYDRHLWGTVEAVCRGVCMLFLGALAGIAITGLLPNVYTQKAKSNRHDSKPPEEEPARTSPRIISLESNPQTPSHAAANKGYRL